MTVNDHPWPLNGGASLAVNGQRVNFFGLRNVPDSNRTYYVEVSIYPFNGTGNYVLTGPGPNQPAGIIAQDSTNANNDDVYMADSLHPGVLKLDEYHSADGTEVGSFAVTMFSHKHPTDSIRVKAEFRLRPNQQ